MSTVSVEGIFFAVKSKACKVRLCGKSINIYEIKQSQFETTSTQQSSNFFTAANLNTENDDPFSQGDTANLKLKEYIF